MVFLCRAFTPLNKSHKPMIGSKGMLGAPQSSTLPSRLVANCAPKPANILGIDIMNMKYFIILLNYQYQSPSPWQSLYLFE